MNLSTTAFTATVEIEGPYDSELTMQRAREYETAMAMELPDGAGIAKMILCSIEITEQTAGGMCFSAQAQVLLSNLNARHLQQAREAGAPMTLKLPNGAGFAKATVRELAELPSYREGLRTLLIWVAENITGAEQSDKADAAGARAAIERVAGEYGFEVCGDEVIDLTAAPSPA